MWEDITVNREERAKQFQPFDALKGLQEELRRREMRVLAEKKRLLSEEEEERLSRRLCRLRKGDWVEFSYYDRGFYRTGEGRVLTLDRENGLLRLEGKTLSLQDLYRLRGGREKHF